MSALLDQPDVVTPAPRAQVLEVPILYSTRQFENWVSRRPERRAAGRVLISGDRRWRDPEPILERLSKLPAGTIVIQGQAEGIDLIARDCAQVLGLPCVGFPALWGQDGRAAGMRRNERMLGCVPHLLLAFHPYIRRSSGTRHMCSIAWRAGVPVELHDAHGNVKVYQREPEQAAE